MAKQGSGSFWSQYVCYAVILQFLLCSRGLVRSLPCPWLGTPPCRPLLSASTGRKGVLGARCGVGKLRHAPRRQKRKVGMSACVAPSHSSRQARRCEAMRCGAV
ncbi:uncharacterized protein LY79DRAFT_389339 [Colletotrichum navitas]|uniref:Uncharacterized protein n=1 Tax=Colletotrichum navitas TaxID=681940 RepID=A0AAD8PPN8_9PEZI|nr:uncharacterized protein LY79DRAFT_389339 [Colletotrichum navitas]KAK1574105.1 hypothetical protein LY79DRAFT_389339 [Colletotrichum navitas]